MNTEQSYVGRGNNATSPPPAAQNAAQASSSPDNRPLYYHDLIESEKQNTLIHVYSIFALDDREENAVTVLARLLESWVLKEYKALARNENDEDLKYWDNYVRQLVHVICSLSTLRDCVASIESLESQLRKEQEGRRHA